MQSIKVQEAAKIAKYLRDVDTFSGQALQGSFSVVSKPIFERIVWLKALAEIYTMSSFEPLSNLYVFGKMLPNIC